MMPKLFEILDSDVEGGDMKNQKRMSVSDMYQINAAQGLTEFAAYNGAQQQNDLIIQRTNMLHEDIVQLHYQTQNRLNLIENKIDGRSKRKRINQSLAVNDQGQILLIDVYDDGFQKARQLILNAFGKWSVYRMKFDKIENVGEWFAIVFANSTSWIMGKNKKIKEAGLYDCFVKAGIKFNSEIPQKSIKSVLFQQFAPEIENCQNEWNFQALAGWGGKNIFTQIASPFLQKMDFQIYQLSENNLSQRGMSTSKLKNTFPL